MARAVLLSRATMMRRTKRGFTLTELAAVVAIIGILAVIGVASYRKLILSSKVTEAKNMIGAIRIAEEDYKAERGMYLDLSSAYCPSNGADQKKWAWENPSCAGNAWAQLPVHADGPVQFGYKVFAGTKVQQPADPFPAALLSVGSYAGREMPYYIVHARADLSPGGDFTEVAGSSFENTIRTLHEGE